MATAVIVCAGSSGLVELPVTMRPAAGNPSTMGGPTRADPPAADCDQVPTPAGSSPGHGPLIARTGAVRELDTQVNVVAVGDVGGSEGLAEPVAQLVARLEPHALLLIGDNVHGPGGRQEFAAQFHPHWSRFRDIWMPVVGNHEYRTPGAAGFRDYFERPTGPLYRCWWVGTWVVVALDSKRPKNGAQLAWLRTILAATKGVPKIVTWHRARYSSGFMGDQRGTRHLWNVIKSDPDVRLVLWAHDHDYERMTVPVDGGTPIDAMVVGTGGGTLEEPTPPMVERPWRAFFVDHTTGVLRLSLGRSSYSWSFIAVPGVVLDGGSRTF